MEHGGASLGRARTFHSNLTIMRGGLELDPARAHNPDDAGSSPALATIY
jgi:hypothetical protein